ncbi:aminopeptidase [Candidatus Dependentiae bacterium]|nr:aminopeptidase [Candidatus Dependentiae bacterium]
MLDKKKLNSYANLLIDFSLEIKKGDKVGIYGNIESSPLIEQLYIELLKRGAHPFPHISLNNQQDIFYAYCQDSHLTYLPEITLFEAKNIDALINISCSVNTKSLSAVDPAKQALFRKTRKPISEIVLKKNRWVLALYPTEAYAQDAEMSLSDFEDFVVDAVKINCSNPVREWKKVWEYQEKVIKRLKGADSVHITGNNTDLKFSVKNRKFINSSGYFNMPSG